MHQNNNNYNSGDQVLGCMLKLLHIVDTTPIVERMNKYGRGGELTLRFLTVIPTHTRLSSVVDL